MTDNSDCSDIQCECDDPRFPGFKLWECGTALCRAIRGLEPLFFNGRELYGEDDKNTEE